MKTKLSILFIALTILAFYGKANAQEQVRSFTISPPAIQVELSPGERKEGTLKITNDSENSLNFNTSIRDFIVEDNQGTPKILPENSLSNKYSGASWLAIYPNQVYVSPHQKSEVSYFIQVPSDARPGGRYAAVVYTPTNATGVDGTGAAVNTSVGTLFYITVKGPVAEKASVKNFTTKGLWEFGPVEIATEILNESDIHIRPVGNITLKNMIGRTSDVKSIEETNIFPGASRSITTEIGKGFMLGRYTASFLARYGSNATPVEATASFWVIPYRAIIFIILLAVAILVGVWYWKKDKHAPKESSEPQQPTQSGY